MIVFHSNSNILGILNVYSIQTNPESGGSGQISTMLLWPTKHRPSLNVVASLMSISRDHILQKQCRAVAAFMGFQLICLKRILRTNSAFSKVQNTLAADENSGLTVWVKLSQTPQQNPKVGGLRGLPGLPGLPGQFRRNFGDLQTIQGEESSTTLWP